MAMVRLYANDGDNQKQSFRKLELGGILAFVMDRKRKTSQLRLFDINGFRLIFQIEVYINMN